MNVLYPLEYSLQTDTALFGSEGGQSNTDSTTAFLRYARCSELESTSPLCKIHSVEAWTCPEHGQIIEVERFGHAAAGSFF